MYILLDFELFLNFCEFFVNFRIFGAFYQKSRENTRKHAKTRENTRKHVKHAKTREIEMLSVNVLSGQFISHKKCGVRVEMELHGTAADSTTKGQFSTKVAMNSLSPRWDNEPPFNVQIMNPALVLVRFVAADEAGKLLGQRTMPLRSVECGYRFLSLRNEFNQTIGMSSLLLQIGITNLGSITNGK